MNTFFKPRLKLLCALLLALCAVLPCACAQEAKKPVIFVSILPQQYFAERLAGSFCEVCSLIGCGASPHSYEPLPKQMSALARAKIFFAIGLPFEKVLIKRLSSSCPSLKISNTDAEIKRIASCTGTKQAEAENELDPHVWLSPDCAVLIAEHMAKALTELFADKKEIIKNNLSALVSDLKALDAELMQMLAPYEGQTIFVFHPAFGYFAKRYKLIQKAVEFEGKNPGVRRLAELIRYCAANKIKVIFVQKQFSTDTAKTIASSIGGKAAILDPLAKDYINNMRAVGKAVCAGLSAQAGLK